MDARGTGVHLERLTGQADHVTFHLLHVHVDKVLLTRQPSWPRALNLLLDPFCCCPLSPLPPYDRLFSSINSSLCFCSLSVVTGSRSHSQFHIIHAFLISWISFFSLFFFLFFSLCFKMMHLSCIYWWSTALESTECHVCVHVFVLDTVNWNLVWLLFSLNSIFICEESCGLFGCVEVSFLMLHMCV